MNQIPGVLVPDVQPVGGYTMGYFKLKEPLDNANMVAVCTVMGYPCHCYRE